MRFLAITLLLAAALPVSAQRVPSTKTIAPRADGPRGDITVPYLTNGRSTLGVSGGVGPIIYSYQKLGSPAQPGGQNVYNLPFYGARLGPSSGVVGASPKVATIIQFTK